MFDDLLSLLFPEHCYGCTIAGTALCLQCQNKLRPALPVSEPKNCFALFDYQQPLVRKAIWELKYYRKSPLAKKMMFSGVSSTMDYISSLLDSATPMPLVIVPIPQHSSKTYQRGFNQSQLLAKWLAAALPTATLQPLLKKTRATDAQSHTHSRHQRQKNLSHSMEARGMFNTKTLYILVDDVITTGSTITEASRALRAAGARNICAIALAHG